MDNLFFFFLFFFSWCNLLQFSWLCNVLSHVFLGFRFPEKIGGNLPGVHYIRDVADADSLISSLVTTMKLSLMINNIQFILLFRSIQTFWSTSHVFHFLAKRKKSCNNWWWLYWNGGCCCSCCLETWYNCKCLTFWQDIDGI